MRHIPRRAGACEGLGDAFGKQVDDMLKDREGEAWVWTVSNQVYGDALADWQVQMQRIGLPNAVVVAVDSDPAWARDLCAMGFQVVDATEQGKVAASVAYAKFVGAAHFARLRTANVFHELDIFWERGAVDVFGKIWDATRGFDIVLESQLMRGTQLNIGLWMSPASASPHMADLMKLALHITEGKHEFDQWVLSELVDKCCTRVQVESPILNLALLRAQKENQSKPLSADFRCPASLKGLRVGVIRANTLVKNGYFGVAPRKDAASGEPAAYAWHFWALSGPLRSGRGKLVVAQNAGLWEGTNCYYEQCAGNNERYIAWDGVLGDATGSRAILAMKLLLDLAWSSGRTLVMPRANGTFGEWFFGVDRFDSHMAFRGSNFLFQPLMMDGALYPVSQVAVDMGRVASLQHTTLLPHMTSKEHFKLAADVPLERALAAMLKIPRVDTSKTVLVSALWPSDAAASSAMSEPSSCGAVAKYLDLCHVPPYLMRPQMLASDVCR